MQAQPGPINMAHRLFSIPELCDCVAEVIPEYNEDFRGGVDPQGPHRKTLVALALVSRTFKDSALDILWKQLTDFIPIARLFPKHVVALTDSGLWDTANAMDPEACLSRCLNQKPLNLELDVLEMPTSHET